MSHLVEFPLAAGGSILVEVDEVAAARTMRGGDRGKELIERSGRTLEETLGGIVPAMSELLHKLREVSSELGQIEVEVGMKLTGEAGMVVARAGAEANFRVLLRWQRPSEVEGS